MNSVYDLHTWKDLNEKMNQFKNFNFHNIYNSKFVLENKLNNENLPVIENEKLEFIPESPI